MPTEEVKNKMKEKVKGVFSEMKKPKVEKRIDSIKYVDGRLIVSFSTNTPAKSGELSSYKIEDRIFDSWDEFSEAGKEFFKEENEE